MWTTTTYRFREIKHPARRRVPCTGCGKKLTRQRTFSQTLNPFNRNAAGEPKTVGEIVRELMVQADAWNPEATCTRCAGPVPAGAALGEGR